MAAVVKMDWSLFSALSIPTSADDSAPSPGADGLDRGTLVCRANKLVYVFRFERPFTTGTTVFLPCNIRPRRGAPRVAYDLRWRKLLELSCWVGTICTDRPPQD